MSQNWQRPLKCLAEQEVAAYLAEVREYGDQNTEISCGADDRFSVRLSPAQAVAALGISVR